MFKLKSILFSRTINGSILSSRTIYNSSKIFKIHNENGYSQKKEYFDIVVCGGGMVGNAMVAILGQDNNFKDLKIALIDTASEKNSYISSKIHNNRVCALNATTVDLLKSFN